MKKIVGFLCLGFLSLLCDFTFAAQGGVGAPTTGLVIDGTQYNNLVAPLYSGGFLFDRGSGSVNTATSTATITVPANVDSAVLLAGPAQNGVVNAFVANSSTATNGNYSSYTVFTGDGLSPNLFVKTPLTTIGTYSFGVGIYSGKGCSSLPSSQRSPCQLVGNWTNNGTTLAPATANVYWSIAVPPIPIRDCVIIFTTSNTGGATTNLSLFANVYTGASIPN